MQSRECSLFHWMTYFPLLYGGNRYFKPMGRILFVDEGDARDMAALSFDFENRHAAMLKSAY